MTSNREHDDSVVRIFICFCGKGRESGSKNCQPGTPKDRTKLVLN